MYEKGQSFGITNKIRKRAWKILEDYCQHDDEWTETNNHYWVSTFDRVYKDIQKQTGDDQLITKKRYSRHSEELKDYFHESYPGRVFDVIEFFIDRLSGDYALKIQSELNFMLRDEQSHWILVEGRFYKLDAQWIETDVFCPVEEKLKATVFEGVLSEFRKSREKLAAGDYKEAVTNASHSIESLLASITGKKDSELNKYIDSLFLNGFCDELPDAPRKAIKSTLNNVAILRHKFGGHGQGKDHFDCPESVAKFAVRMMGVTSLFLIEWYLHNQTTPNTL